MRFLIQLAWKNLLRHKKRTAITCIAIAMGIGMLIWFDSSLRWADEESQRNLKKFEFGNFLIGKSDYIKDRDNLPLDSLLSQKDVATLMLIAGKNSLNSCKRTLFRSSVSHNRGYGLPYMVVAIEPGADTEVYHVNEHMVEGAYLTEGVRGCMISTSIKKDLKASLGDTLSIFTKTPYETRQLIRIKVAGIFDVPDPIVQSSYVFIPASVADRELQVEGRAGEVVFKTPSGENEPYLSKTMADVKDIYGDAFDVATWQELGHEYFSMSQTKKGGSFTMLLFMFIIIAVGIINTMLMAVLERIREIGMMRALGMKDSRIIWAFVFEAFGIGLIGSLAGIMFGILLDLHLIYFGLDFTFLLQGQDIGYRTGTVFHGVWNVDMMIIGCLFAIACSVLVAIIPARKAVKMEITEAVREK
ncbi:ABC transporter permease [Spirochaetota bacterium]